MVQLTLTGTLVGVALGQLVAGPVSDVLGRRAPLLAGPGLHVAASVRCVLAPTIEVPGALRGLHGLGAAVAAVTALAVASDLFDGAGAARLVGRLVLVIGASPVLAPTLTAQVLRTRAAIADLNARSAWALDLRDWDRLRDVLVADGHYVNVGRDLQGAPAVVASFRGRGEERIIRHGLGNLLLRDGPDRTVLGLSSWNTFANNTNPAPVIPLFMVADFHDTYAHNPAGSWRIAERIITPVFRDDALAPRTPGASP